MEMQAASSSSLSFAREMVIQQLLAFSAVLVACLAVSAQGTEFAIYKLSLIWPASACIPTKNCKTPIPKFFTIHGLWPTYKSDKPVPPYDATTNKCNVNPVRPQDLVPKLATIRPRLETKWPNLRIGKTDDIFWETEWAHHGMCSDYPQDPLTYFDVTLNLSNLYDPLRVLGVQPSNTPHPIETLLENVYKNLGAYPQISCSMPVKGKQLYLKEIRFCFKRARPPFELRNCTVDMDDMCRSVPPADRNIMFPSPPTISWPRVSSDLLVFVQWVIIGFLLLYILTHRNSVKPHVE